jgi:hypothetical protein
MIVHDLESLLPRLLKWLAAAIGVSLVVLLLLNIFGPSAKGTPPDQAILDVGGLMDDATNFGKRRITTVDFVDRPLFRPDRRQPPDLASNVTTAKPEAAPEGGEAVESLDGVTATGVFASGDTSGVFLKAEGGERTRIQVGDDYEGWVLASVDATGANFLAGDRRARVELVLNFNPVVLVEQLVAPVAEVGSDDSSTFNAEAGNSGAETRPESADKGEDNAGAPRQALTFDNMMQDRMLGQEAQERRGR